MSFSADFGVWVAALLTLCIFSFLWRDNPLYKFAEHLFVGVSAGYYIALNWWTVVDQYLVVPLRAVLRGELEGGAFAASMQDYRIWLLIPAVLGVLLFTRLFTGISWLSRWSLAVVIGVFAGLKTTGFAQGDLVAQVQASLMPLWVPGDPWASFNAILFTVGLATSLLFFFYSREQKGFFGGVSRVGVWFLMISFGAGYGYTVMSRISLLIGRVQFLLFDWLHLR